MRALRLPLTSATSDLSDPDEMKRYKPVRSEQISIFKKKKKPWPVPERLTSAAAAKLQQWCQTGRRVSQNFMFVRFPDCWIKTYEKKTWYLFFLPLFLSDFSSWPFETNNISSLKSKQWLCRICSVCDSGLARRLRAAVGPQWLLRVESSATALFSPFDPPAGASTRHFLVWFWDTAQPTADRAEEGRSYKENNSMGAFTVCARPPCNTPLE